MSEIRLIHSTVGSVEDAEKIADTLVRERVAACVGFVPRITSVYRWKGRIERETETMLIIKTAADRVDAAMARLRELHPYEVPEIVVIPVERASESYRDWVLAETR